MEHIAIPDKLCRIIKRDDKDFYKRGRIIYESNKIVDIVLLDLKPKEVRTRVLNISDIEHI